MKKSGFTLTELMIALGILGVLSALVLPMLNGNSPNRNRMMMKKAYYTIEDIVGQLINNDIYYPLMGEDGTVYKGFDNMTNVCGNLVGEDQEGSAKGGILNNTCQGYYKFPKLFAKELNVEGDMKDEGISHTEDGNDAVTVDSGGVSFKTQDGMFWKIESVSYVPEVVSTAEPSATIVHQILVDVNGDKAPNCFQGSPACANRKNNFDQFKVYVTTKGKIVPAAGQEWFEKAIGLDSSIGGE